MKLLGVRHSDSFPFSTETCRDTQVIKLRGFLCKCSKNLSSKSLFSGLKRKSGSPMKPRQLACFLKCSKSDGLSVNCLPGNQKTKDRKKLQRQKLAFFWVFVQLFPTHKIQTASLSLISRSFVTDIDLFEEFFHISGCKVDVKDEAAVAAWQHRQHRVHVCN